MESNFQSNDNDWDFYDLWIEVLKQNSMTMEAVIGHFKNQENLQEKKGAIISEKQVNCEQFSGEKYLEEHNTITHDSPKEDYSGKRVNISSNVSEAEIEFRRNNYQIKLQPVTKGEIKEEHSSLDLSKERMLNATNANNY